MEENNRENYLNDSEKSEEIVKEPVHKPKPLVKKNMLRSFLDKLYKGEKSDNKIVNKLISFLKVFIATTRKFLADDCLTKASSIAYTLIVSLVPTLTVALTFYSFYAGADKKRTDKNRLAKNIFFIFFSSKKLLIVIFIHSSNYSRNLLYFNRGNYVIGTNLCLLGCKCGIFEVYFGEKVKI